jgi:hypothetical protein
MAGDHLERASRQLSGTDGPIGCNPGGVGLVLPGESRRRCLVGTGAQSMNALPFVSLVLAHRMFEPGKQLGEGVAERCVLRLVGEGPDVVDGLVKLVEVDRLRRFGCGEEHAKCGVPREFEAQAIEVVGDGTLVARFGESVGAQVPNTDAERARQGS